MSLVCYFEAVKAELRVLILFTVFLISGLSARSETIVQSSTEIELDTDFELESIPETQAIEEGPMVDVDVGPIFREKTPPQPRTPPLNLEERTFFRPRRDSQQSAQKSPIWNVFVRHFNKCAPGCEPVKYHAYRSPQQTIGCHRSGHALDVFGIKCGGRTYMAQDEYRQNGEFTKFVQCMRPRIKTIWRNGHLSNNAHTNTLHHWDHVHFSIGCRNAYGQSYW